MDVEEENKLLVALLTKKDKHGLSDELLKKTLDDFYQRCKGNGKTKTEERVERLEEVDERLDLERINLK